MGKGVDVDVDVDVGRGTLGFFVKKMMVIYVYVYRLCIWYMVWFG